jgi:hypothetical protein
MKNSRWQQPRKAPQTPKYVDDFDEKCPQGMTSTQAYRRHVEKRPRTSRNEQKRRRMNQDGSNHARHDKRQSISLKNVRALHEMSKKDDESRWQQPRKARQAPMTTEQNDTQRPNKTATERRKKRRDDRTTQRLNEVTRNNQTTFNAMTERHGNQTTQRLNDIRSDRMTE